MSLLYIYDLSPFEFFTGRKLQVTGGAELCPMLKPVPLAETIKSKTTKSKIDHDHVRTTVIADIKNERHLRKGKQKYLEERFHHPQGSLLHIVKDLIPEYTKKGLYYESIDHQVKRVGLIAEMEEVYRVFKEKRIPFNYTNIRKVFYPTSRIRGQWIQDLIQDMKSGVYKVPTRKDLLISKNARLVRL